MPKVTCASTLRNSHHLPRARTAFPQTPVDGADRDLDNRTTQLLRHSSQSPANNEQRWYGPMLFNTTDSAEQDRPGPSAAVDFGAGVIAGTLIVNGVSRDKQRVSGHCFSCFRWPHVCICMLTISGAVGLVVGQPFDVVKVRWQTPEYNGRYASITGAFRGYNTCRYEVCRANHTGAIVREEGVSFAMRILKAAY